MDKSSMRQMGLVPDRPLTAVTETFDVLRQLLRGATVRRSTSTYRFDGVPDAVGRAS